MSSILDALEKARRERGEGDAAGNGKKSAPNKNPKKKGDKQGPGETNSSEIKGAEGGQPEILKRTSGAAQSSLATGVKAATELIQQGKQGPTAIHSGSTPFPQTPSPGFQTSGSQSAGGQLVGAQPRSLLVLLALLFIAALVLSGAIAFLAISLRSGDQQAASSGIDSSGTNQSVVSATSDPQAPMASAGLSAGERENLPEPSEPEGSEVSGAEADIDRGSPAVANTATRPSPSVPSQESRAPTSEQAVPEAAPREPQIINLHAEDFLGFRIGGVLNNDGISTLLINGREHDLGETVGGYFIKSIDRRVIVLVKEETTFRIRY